MSIRTFGWLYVVAGLAVLSACSDEGRRVEISGTVLNANGEKLYLEHLSGSRPEIIDSVTLSATGQFRFRPEAEEGPDFFALRLVTQSIPLVTDTLCTPVHVEADLRNFATGYKVTDADNLRLKEASALGDALRRDILDANRAFNDGRLTDAGYRDSVLALVSAYKRQVLERYIYPAPSDPVSYYILFQSVRGLSIFDPYDPGDNRAFGAIATGWMFNYPNSPRNRHLEKVTREGQALRQRSRLEAQRADSALTTPIVTSNFFDLELPDLNDHPVALSSFVDGSHVIVLDFTAYYLPVSVQHNQLLNRLYERYKDRGLVIYQVCLDPDENFWKVSASRVPWTAVRDTEVIYDAQGYVQYSRPAGVYNVQNLPTVFVLATDGSVEARVDDAERLEAEIVSRLK